MENIENEVQLDNPEVALPWFADADTCRNLLVPHGAKEDGTDEVVTFSLENVTFLGIKNLFLALRNDLQPHNLLQRVEFHHDTGDIDRDLQEINSVVEEVMGQNPVPYPDYNGLLWEREGVQVSSYVQDSPWGSTAVHALEKIT